MQKKPIGILGGMGPEATALLLMRVIQFTPAQDDSDHIPLFIDNNTQVPSRIKALIEKTGADPAPVLQTMAQQLERNGSLALAMPCNTAHYYSKQIQQAVNIPLLNLIELSADAILNTKGDHLTVGLIGSPAIKQLGLFETEFSARGISIIYPKDQTLILTAIKALKIDSRDQQARSIFKQACIDLIEQGADSILIGCSEFSIINDEVPNDIQSIDTMDVLAKAIVQFSIPINE